MSLPASLENATWRLLPEAMIWIDRDTLTIIDANPAAERLFGAPGHPLAGTSLLQQLRPRNQEAFIRGMTRNGGSEQWVALVRPHGEEYVIARWLGLSTGPAQTLALLRLTEERSDVRTSVANTEAGRLAWAFDALHEATWRALHAADEATFLSTTCAGITAGNRYPLAWIGLAVDDGQRRISVAAKSGTAAHYLDGITVRWDDSPQGNGPTGQAIRTGKTQLNNHASNNPAFALWRERAARYGLAASIAVPLYLEHRVIGTLTIYASEAEAFGDLEVRLFEQLAQYLTLALTGFRAQEALRAEATLRAEAAAKLEKVLEQAIETLSGTLAERDPYTVGHQIRVAAIAEKIARHLGLSNERCHVLRLAAIVHDVGKIRVPMELLSKPTPLRPQEIAVLRQHVQGTVDILSKIDWPWPLQEIAGQHHERLDGSGYPAGLKGDQILLESRILAVADTLEAMSSRRPYRPAKGMAAALAEISRHRGTKYDPAVVDAALAIMSPSSDAEHGEA